MMRGARGREETREIWDAYIWSERGAEKQKAPEGDWAVWLLMAGRGFGKTRAGAEWVRERISRGEGRRVALVAPTPDDVRNVMVEGVSGLLRVSPPWFRPKYEPSKRKLTWPNGATALGFSSYEPDRLRGPQFDTAWCDELASWKNARETWDNLQFGLRLGESPRCAVTTTPKPIGLLRELKDRKDVFTTTGSTYENRANLASEYIEHIRRRYEGTRTGRQEIYAELLDESEDALWKRDWIEAARVREAPELARVVVAVDPAVSSRGSSSETGIVVAGADEDGHAYILEDASGQMSPDGWARRAIGMLDKYGADRIVGESNNGGDLVEHTVRTAYEDRYVPYKSVHASRGKYARAEPVSALYEQGKVHHVGGLDALEDQMCIWSPGSDGSSDRLDALVWAVTELLLNRTGVWLWV